MLISPLTCPGFVAGLQDVSAGTGEVQDSLFHSLLVPWFHNM